MSALGAGRARYDIQILQYFNPETGLLAVTSNDGRLIPFAKERIDYVLLFLLVLPSLLWILLDRRVWTSDEALYGLLALKLHRQLWYDATGWWGAMLSITDKPPMLPWVGQFFVPLGRIMGNIDSGLLVVTFIASFASVILFYEALRSLFTDRWTVLVGALVLASAPVFLSVSRTFYVQPLQLAAVAWFVYIMAHSEDWDSTYIVLQMISAGAFAMLTMLSSPAFCILPILVSGFHILKAGKSGWQFGWKHIPILVLSVVLLAGAISWYLRNAVAALAWASFSSRYVFGGDAAGYWGKLALWTILLLYGLFLWILPAVVTAVLVGWAFLRYVKSRQTAGHDYALLIVGAILQITFVIIVFSLSAQQNYRYILPLMPYLAFVLAWAVLAIGRTWSRVLVTGLFLFQFLVFNLIYFGAGVFNSSHFGVIDWVEGGQSLQRSRSRNFELLQQIAVMTSDAGDKSIFLATGALGLYNLNVEYYALQASKAVARRHYESVEFMLTGSATTGEIGPGVEVVWRRILASNPAYVVITNEGVRRASIIQYAGQGWEEIVRGADEISKRVMTSGLFIRVPLPKSPEIEIYRLRLS